MAVDHLSWERRQAELWDRIFQATQDVAALADTMGSSAGVGVIRQELVKSAMAVGAHLVRANAAENKEAFLHSVTQARLQAVETDYWLRLGYMLQHHETGQHDVSGIITQYTAIVDLLQKFLRHAEGEKDVIARHTRGPRIN